MVEEMLAARGIEIVRQWALFKFGQEFTNRIRRRLPQAADKFAYRKSLLPGGLGRLLPGSRRRTLLHG